MKFNKISICLKPFLNGLSFFLGVLFLGLMSCSSATVSSPSSPTEDKTPPTVIISTNESLEIGKTGTITFTFSEKVTNFTPDEIQLLMNGVTNSLGKDKFVTNGLTNYFLDITPKIAGTLTVSIPANSFEDLSGNQNTDSFSTNFSVEDKTPPTVTISTNESLEIGKTGTITFTFSEKVTNFTPDEIQLLMNGVNVDKDKFVTNNQESYSLQITPKAIGTLHVIIPANSFEDLSGNQNNEAYSSNFTVFRTYTIYFKPLNGGSFISPQITNLKVVSNTAIEQTKLGGILSYPPTGPKPGINAVTRGIFEWRNNGTKYELSTPVSSDLTLEAVWSNSCGKVETLHPANRDELKTYTDKAMTANATTNLNHIDTSAITDMYSLFDRANVSGSPFNGEIGCWNTANVTNVYRIFKDAYAFNQNIGSWNVVNVNNMKDMFGNAYNFNRDIGSWNVANVTDMSYMFNGARAFNQNISSWDVVNVNNMDSMFNGARAFNQNISNWNVANVKNMYGMFHRAYAFNQDISSWNVSKVNNMKGMFYFASNFNQNIGNWNVANVNNMREMFAYASSFNKDIGSWDVGNVTDMRWMFYAASVFNQDISSWDVSKVTNMNSMFSSARAFNQNISNWNVANVTDMNSMFIAASVFNQNISGWDVGNVTDMSYMFSGTTAFNQDLSGWSVSNVKKHSYMFKGSTMESRTSQHPRFSSP